MHLLTGMAFTLVLGIVMVALFDVAGLLITAPFAFWIGYTIPDWENRSVR